ncbi:hypothetical protein llap_5982 [Limosa lapponica baueri]|uniref:Uncharacterized protein n=1 Tax=Limosa lapponica baueri TaxID=1758121 RepID=A0A2I0UCB7_LIMLA|nr:hypothetical protein llap_5982 [Limosa lapponica baueri]
MPGLLSCREAATSSVQQNYYFSQNTITEQEPLVTDEQREDYDRNIPNAQVKEEARKGRGKEEARKRKSKRRGKERRGEERRGEERRGEGKGRRILAYCLFYLFSRSCEG